MAFVANLKKPNLAYIHLTSTATNFNFEKFLHNASARLQGINLVVSGHTLSYRKSIPPNVLVKRSPFEVMEFLRLCFKRCISPSILKYFV